MKYRNRSWKTTFLSSSVAFSTFFAIKATCLRLLIFHASKAIFKQNTTLNNRSGTVNALPEKSSRWFMAFVALCCFLRRASSVIINVVWDWTFFLFIVSDFSSFARCGTKRWRLFSIAIRVSPLPTGAGETFLVCALLWSWIDRSTSDIPIIIAITKQAKHDNSAELCSINCFLRGTWFWFRVLFEQYDYGNLSFHVWRWSPSRLMNTFLSPVDLWLSDRRFWEFVLISSIKAIAIAAPEIN